MKILDTRSAAAAQGPSAAESLGSTIFYISVISYTTFIGFYIFYYQFIIMKGKMYPDTYHANTGYHLHVVSGSIYFITGILQFCSFIRQRYPKIHRYSGYIYYLMVPVTSIGVIWVCFKPHAGSSARIGAATMLPIWIALNVMSYRAVVYFRDIDLHRQLNIAGLALSSAIVAMRPLVGLLVVMDGYYELGPQLSVALWIGFSWMSIAVVTYITFVYRIPSQRRPRLLHDGSITLGGNLQPPVTAFLPAEILSIQRLDAHTIVMRIKPRNIDFQVNYPPGFHIIIRLGGVSREFTPVNYLEDIGGSGYGSVSQDVVLEIVIRVIPGGRFALAINDLLSQLLHPHDERDITNGITAASVAGDRVWHSVPSLSSLLDRSNSDDSDDSDDHGDSDGDSDRKTKAAIKPQFMTCGVYGPLYPLPWRFGYLIRHDPHDRDKDHGREEGGLAAAVTTKSGEESSSFSRDTITASSTVSVLPAEFKQSNIPRTLIMIGAGTGITAFLSTIHAALLNKSDCTRLRMLFLPGRKSGGSCKQYFDDKINLLATLPQRRKQIEMQRQLQRQQQQQQQINTPPTTPTCSSAAASLIFSRRHEMPANGAGVNSEAHLSSGEANSSVKKPTFTDVLFRRRRVTNSGHIVSTDTRVSTDTHLASTPTASSDTSKYDEYVRHHNMRFQSTTSYERFQPSMISQWIEEECNNGVAVWVCGPPGQGEFVRQQLLAVEDPSLKLRRSQIFVIGVDDR